jgi:hypothetical protein
MKSGVAAATLLPLALSMIPAGTSLSQNAAAPSTSQNISSGPVPLLSNGNPVDWWFVFKLNGYAFPGCGSGGSGICLFGGTARPYTTPHGQQYIYASSQNPTLRQGSGCAGTSTSDPIGATYSEIYNGSYHYVVWNDQFLTGPLIKGCPKGDCSEPWGHSKGMVAWDDDGNGLIMQVTTPSWPASGSSQYQRAGDGNTLGCVHDDNVEWSQQFFALKLTEDDLIKVLTALVNASVATDISNPQIVNNGGPSDVMDLVNQLGRNTSTSTSPTQATLSTGVQLISKPSAEMVPPWQMVSALLGGANLRVASWWGPPDEIDGTRPSTPITCWSPSLHSPGTVEIATSGQWSGTAFGLVEGTIAKPAGNGNHAKIGVSTDSSQYVIFGDMNQQGSLSADQGCKRSQNPRGGLFFVLDSSQLHADVSNLIAGDTGPFVGSSSSASSSTTPAKTSKTSKTSTKAPAAAHKRKR